MKILKKIYKSSISAKTKETKDKFACGIEKIPVDFEYEKDDKMIYSHVPSIYGYVVTDFKFILKVDREVSIKDIKNNEYSIEYLIRDNFGRCVTFHDKIKIKKIETKKE